MGEPGLQSRGESRYALAVRLREREPELRAAAATRVRAISDPREVPDPAYRQALEAALPAAVDHALTGLELGERQLLEPPPPLLAQARLAARDGVPVDTLMRQYFAVSSLLGDFLAAEAERAAVPSAALRQLLGSQAALFDRLLAAIGAEYAQEARIRPAGAAERRRECVKRLLAGEQPDRSELGYDLDAAHLALMARGEGVQELMPELAARLDRNLLAVQREEEPVWACWLGGRRPLGSDRVVAELDGLLPAGVLVTVGEPGEGLGGWRFSHRQAKAALPIAARGERPVLRYADAAVLAATLSDGVTADSLRQLYLAPLEAERDGGEVARRTLRAYFAAERNISSTAAALGVDRRTVRNRLRAVEELLGRSLGAAAPDLEVALRLDQLSPD